MALLGILVSALSLFAYLRIKPANNQTKEVNATQDSDHTPRGTAPILASKSIKPETVSHQADATHKRRKVPDWLKFLVNVLALMALVWYAWEAKRQRVAMDKTLNLQTQQLANTQAAIVRVNGIGLGPIPQIGKVIEISLEFRNEGIDIASNVNVHAKMGLFHVSDKGYKGGQVDCGGIIPHIVHETNEYIRCKLTGISDDEL